MGILETGGYRSNPLTWLVLCSPAGTLDSGSSVIAQDGDGATPEIRCAAPPIIFADHDAVILVEGRNLSESSATTEVLINGVPVRTTVVSETFASAKIPKELANVSTSPGPGQVQFGTTSVRCTPLRVQVRINGRISEAKEIHVALPPETGEAVTRLNRDLLDAILDCSGVEKDIQDDLIDQARQQPTPKKKKEDAALQSFLKRTHALEKAMLEAVEAQGVSLGDALESTPDRKELKALFKDQVKRTEKTISSFISSNQDTKRDPHVTLGTLTFGKGKATKEERNQEINQTEQKMADAFQPTAKRLEKAKTRHSHSWWLLYWSGRKTHEGVY